MKAPDMSEAAIGWRDIVLLGRNVATYKFALARSLLELGASGVEAVPLEDLAVPFARHICDHLAEVDVQGTFSSSKFLDACRHYNAGRINADELRVATVLLGFENVIDAFHVVPGRPEVGRFFVDERRASTRGIRLTESVLELAAGSAAEDLDAEAEARWRLVEATWAERSEGHQLTVEYDRPSETLVSAIVGRRRSLAWARPSLNGYQQSHCFYCFRLVSAIPGAAEAADVDHVFPHVLMSRGLAVDLDGVWNLVLACGECNRGAGGKFDALPDDELVMRLHLRNERLIASHHPLRETIIARCGASTEQRWRFLRRVEDAAAERSRRPRWIPQP